MTGVHAKFIVFAAACIALGSATVAHAADLLGSCCIDLEERITELEATAARKGNRKVSLTVSGVVNQSVLFWDDGFESNAYVVGNENDQTTFSFTGKAQISGDVTAGYDLTLQVEDNTSDGVDQDSASTGGGFTVWKSNWFLDAKSLGRITVGLASRATDAVPESDLSEASDAGYAGVQDIGGGFFLRRSDGTLFGATWGSLIDHFNGDPANVVRYDTPTLMGFVASVSWGEDDIWDIALRYTKSEGDVQVDAAIGYTEVRDVPSDFADVDNSTLVGSASVLHEPSGLNLTVAAGVREFDAAITDADGTRRTPQDAKYIYAKIGWLAELTSLGPTAFYGEYGHFEHFLTVIDDLPLVQSLALTATHITGSKADVWGIGVVQHVEAAEMQIYIGYRNHSADFDLVDGASNSVAATKIEDFHTVIAGSKIAF